MANGFAGQTLQVGSEIAVSSFDVGGEGFSDDLFFGRQHFMTGFELVGAEKAVYAHLAQTVPVRMTSNYFKKCVKN
jgi:hypothetical protein